MAWPPFFMARREMFEIDRTEVNWEAVRADYMTGGASMAALARKYGVKAYAVRKRARAEGWAAGGATEEDGAGADGPEAAVGVGADSTGTSAGSEASEVAIEAGADSTGASAGGEASEAAVGAWADSTGASAGDEASEAADGAGSDSEGGARPEAAASAGGEVRVARRTRMALLQMLERAAATIPCDATEVKTTGDGGEVKLLKLRDLTAAYMELAGDLPAEDADGGSRVVIDV